MMDNRDRTPIFSIIVPTFRRPDLAVETLKSIQRQTNSNFQVILVDDGSDAETIRALTKFVSLDSRFSLHHREGPYRFCAARRNQGFSLAKGRYIVFLDSDDLLEPTALCTRLAAIESGNFDFIVAPAKLFSSVPGDKGNALYFPRWREDASRDLHDFLSGDAVWQAGSAMYRKSFLEATGLFNVAIESAEDIEFHVRLILSKGRYRKLPNPDFWYRVNGDGSITSDSNLQTQIWRNRKYVDLILALSREVRKQAGNNLELLCCIRRRAIQHAILARLSGLPYDVSFDLLDAAPIVNISSVINTIEVKLMLRFWFRAFDKIPALSYLNLRGMVRLANSADFQ